MPKTPKQRRPIPLHLLGAGLGVLAFFASLGVAQAQTLRDTEIELYLRKESAPIMTASGIDPKTVRYLIVNSNDINAFSTTGNVTDVTTGPLIALNTGLINEVQSPNQLLGVIAHEAGHLSGGHISRSGEMSRAGMAPFLLTLGLGALAAAAGAPDAAGALLMSAQTFGSLGAMKYSRVQEAAADQAAAVAMEKAGMSGRGLVEFFNTFRYQETFAEARRYEMFVDHPLSSDRIEALRRKVEAQPHYTAEDSKEAIEGLDVIKAKLEAYLSPPQQIFIKYKDTDTRFTARYARAIAYYRDLQPEKALKALDALIAENPKNPYLWEVKGQLLFESGRAVEAVPAHQKSVEIMPDAPLLRLNLAQSQLAINPKPQLDEAITNLQLVLNTEPTNFQAWELLSQAYDSKKMPGEARLAAAEARYSIGAFKEARSFALRAKDHLTKDSPGWRRCNDIILASDPKDEDLRQIARSTGEPTGKKRPTKQ